MRSEAMLGRIVRALPWRKGAPQRETPVERLARVAVQATYGPRRGPRGDARTRRQVRGRAAAMRGRKANVARLRKERAR